MCTRSALIKAQRRRIIGERQIAPDFLFTSRSRHTIAVFTGGEFTFMALEPVNKLISGQLEVLLVSWICCCVKTVAFPGSISLSI